ncbi:MAG: hypothetical protein L3J33_12940 [Rhodobacteraceae bacterium]|nr:hypothetical protein [Paracoccaceae bacterium]
MAKFRVVLVLTIGAVLSACGFSPTEGIHREITVKSGGATVVIAGPAGFCIDERTVDQSRAGAFVFLSDCAMTENSGPTIARVPISAVLTASVSNSGLPGVEQGLDGALADLQGFLETPIGQVSLGKSGNMNTISVLSLSRTENAVIAFVEDTTITSTTAESPRFWRAFTEIGGRLVALSATGYNRNDPEQERIGQIMMAFIASLHTANPK